MEKRSRVIRVLILIFVGLIVVLNVMGLVVELLVETGVINVDSVKIKGILHPSSILSLIFVISGIIFWINLYKKSHRQVMWWNIFMLTVLAIIISKIVLPTALVELIPFYFVIIPLIYLLIWVLVFKYLKKNEIYDRYGWTSALK